MNDELRKLARAHGVDPDELPFEEDSAHEVILDSCQLRTDTKFGFWRTLGRLLTLRCVCCGGQGWVFSMYLKVDDKWVDMENNCGCPRCGAHGGD